MQTASYVLLAVAVVAVAVVLLLGLINMTRGGSAERSQSLMRWRVLLQFGAIAVAMVAIWASGNGPGR